MRVQLWHTDGRWRLVWINCVWCRPLPRWVRRVLYVSDGVCFKHYRELKERQRSGG